MRKFFGRQESFEIAYSINDIAKLIDHRFMSFLNFCPTDDYVKCVSRCGPYTVKYARKIKDNFSRVIYTFGEVPENMFVIVEFARYLNSISIWKEVDWDCLGVDVP